MSVLDLEEEAKPPSEEEAASDDPRYWHWQDVLKAFGLELLGKKSLKVRDMNDADEDHIEVVLGFLKARVQALRGAKNTLIDCTDWSAMPMLENVTAHTRLSGEKLAPASLWERTHAALGLLCHAGERVTAMLHSALIEKRRKRGAEEEALLKSVVDASSTKHAS